MTMSNLDSTQVIKEVYDSTKDALKTVFGQTYTAESLLLDVSTTGNNVLLAGTPSKRIRIWNLILVPDDSIIIKFIDSDNNQISGEMNLSLAGNGMVLGPGNTPWYVLPEGKGFGINLSDNVQIGGSFVYTME